MPKFTQTLTITWNSFETDMPEPSRDLLIKDMESNYPCKFYLAVNLDGWLHIWDSDGNNRASAPSEYKTRFLWAYADEIKSVHSDGNILPNTDDLITQDNVASFAIVSVSCDLFYYEEPYENVIAEVVMKDGTKIPFDVPVFKDALQACHPHTLFYNGNRYIIDIMPNDDDKTHKEKYRGCHPQMQRSRTSHLCLWEHSHFLLGGALWLIAKTVTEKSPKEPPTSTRWNTRWVGWKPRTCAPPVHPRSSTPSKPPLPKDASSWNR